MTNFNEYKFGVEIEFTGATTQTVANEMQTILQGTGIQVCREGYNHVTRSHWKVTTDATVTENRNYRDGSGYGGELVSPVLHGEAGLQELKQILDALNQVDNGAVRVDRRCGVHVHLSWDGMTVDHVKEVYKRYAQYEADIDAWMAPSRRGNNSRWCASIANNNRHGLRDVEAYSGTLSRMANLCGRYYKVNLQSLGRYGTVEFRQHGGSTEYAKIGAWVKFLMGFVEASKTTRGANGPSLNYRPSSNKVYSAMREQFAMVGYNMKWARGHNWDVYDADGNHVSRKTIAELDAMYINKRLTPAFADWFNQITETPIEADTLFAKVDAETQAYLTARAEQFAQRAA